VQGRNEFAERFPDGTQYPEIGAYRLNPITIFPSLGAKVQELHHSFEILAIGASRDAHYVLHIG
jgi:hypothetical protein